MTSAYFACRSKRFASCGAGWRSPTASRTTSGTKPCWQASTAVARTQPEVETPATRTVSTRSARRAPRRGLVPKNALAYCLLNHRLARQRLEAFRECGELRVPAALEARERRELPEEHAAVGAARLVDDVRVHHRDAGGARESRAASRPPRAPLDAGVERRRRARGRRATKSTTRRAGFAPGSSLRLAGAGSMPSLI